MYCLYPQGMIKDWKPNGFGYMAQRNGISVEGYFTNGALIQPKADDDE